MPHSLKDLLGNAISRANISREVTAAQIVLEANRYFDSKLGTTKRKDMKAISYSNTILTIATLSSPAAQYVSQLQAEIIAHIVSVLPTASITRIQTRVMHKFPQSEVC